MTDQDIDVIFIWARALVFGTIVFLSLMRAFLGKQDKKSRLLEEVTRGLR